MAWKLLQPAINLGLSEFNYWDMTIAEIQRWIEVATWRLKQQATFDYQLADLIGIYSARMLSNEVKFPSIEEVYPSLFGNEIVEEQPIVKDDITTISQNRFLAFAQAHNARMQKGVED
jgi:hypothetical protein